MGRKRKHPYYWVICSNLKNYRGIFNEKCCWGYWAERTSLKNPRFVSTNHIRVKWFETKEDAFDYFYAKSRKGHEVSKFMPKRKKMFIDKKGKYDYWKNRENLLR